ncbi:polysaccharide biosynthesis/export family protein [Arenimonas sp.]|uniref:polysaccharide biosynthesis/export family protein n=1 Tax=Arenimonas sp. TaxID=1872635 RepID=UPI002E3068CC|nr:polysaccharide biosynthesis/export family protein [Arenimonas sp.]HEX4854365.1 polysaccharide biosynthesis/export family protein [Arenimonas sp.]
MIPSILRTLVVLFLSAALVACGTSSSGSVRAGTTKAVTTTDSLAAPDTTAESGAFTGVSDYRIGALDMLQITVFQLDDLDREVRVNTSGMVSLPLIGAVQAGGKTVSELEALIASKLSETYLQNPQVSVFVKEFTSQRVTVEGAVRKPGIFPITGRTTLLQAVAMSEGLDPLADPSSVVVFRTIEGQRMAALFDLRAIRAGDAEDPLIYGEDIIVVDQSGGKTAIKSITDALRGIVGFRTF